MVKVIPDIRTSKQLLLIGKRAAMSFTNNTTFQLWSSFMPKRGEIGNVEGSELYSVQVYPDNFFSEFNPASEFEKWAAVVVSAVSNIPDGMDSITISPGLYAVFRYKGSNHDAASFYNYIFREWLPGSGYTLDNRPHFEVMDDKYKNSSHDSEEDIWIPVR